jgi:hypothetical protein
MHRRFAYVPAIVLAVALLVVPAARGSVENAPTAAAPPTTMTYQGLLRVNGAPANGSFNLQFKLYSMAVGGSALYTEADTVIATNGLFTVDLGQNTPLPPSLFQGGGPLFLGITVGTDPELTPRTPLTTEPFAFLAGTADSATNFSGSLGGDVTGTQAATVVSAVGGQTASSVAGTVTKVAAATSADTASTLALRDGSGSLALLTLTLDGSLTLPNTNSLGTVGLLTLGGNRFLHNAGTNNTFLGALAGAFSMPGSANTAVGAAALQNIAGGTGNAAVGSGALGANTSGGSNTAVGSNALQSNSDGSSNTAVGSSALQSNTHASQNTAVGVNALATTTDVGGSNTAVGFSALQNSTSGSDNAAVGFGALSRNTTGGTNTAMGSRALFLNTTGGSNTAVGHGALQNLTTGGGNTAVGDGALSSLTMPLNSNIAVGQSAGSMYTTGSSNIAIGNSGGSATETNTIRIGTAGNQTQTFIAGIAGVNVNNSAPVLIDTTTGQLGTVVSSRRFKDAIADLGATSEVLYQLRPVSFVYKPEYGGRPDEPQVGLIAEEVAAVAPWLVAYDGDGQPFTVRYQELPPLLLNELQAQQRTIEQQASEQAALRARLAAQDAAIASLQAQVAALAARAAPQQALEQDERN